MPYVAVAEIFQYVLRLESIVDGGRRALLSSVEALLCEGLLLSTSNMVSAAIPPIWFLSAMFLVFPLFSVMLSSQTHRAVVYCYLSWLIPVLYYGAAGVVSRKPWPHDLLRAFACMCLGVLAYQISLWLAALSGQLWTKCVISVFELAAVAISVLCTYHNTGNTRLIVMAFIVIIACAMSGRSLLQTIHCPLIVGETSMVMFLLHWPMKTYLIKEGVDVTAQDGMRVYYLLSVALSVALIIVVTFLERQYEKYKIKKWGGDPTHRAWNVADQ